MSLLDCYEKIWGCCDASISPSKFNAFSAETEEKINDLQKQIDNIEISGITYSAGTNIDITDHVISVTGIDTSTFASKEDLNELSGQTDNIKDDLEELSGKVETLSATVDTKQDTLVSGTNIKTINNTSLLGSGNIVIEGGGTVDPNLDINSDNAVANSAITNAINTISGSVSTKQDTLTAGDFIDISSNTISAKIVVLTQQQWASLTVKDPTVLYLIKED